MHIRYGKLSDYYDLVEQQGDKPYYNKPDLLKVAEHPFHDTELRAFLNKLKFTKGKYKGKKFAESGVITRTDEVFLEYYKSKNIHDRIIQQAEMPFTERFIEDIDYVFPTQKKAEEFMTIVTDFINHSHIWNNCGYSPAEMFGMSDRNAPKILLLGPGIRQSIADGDIDENELIAQFKAMGFEVE